jgi:NAD+ kinase
MVMNGTRVGVFGESVGTIAEAVEAAGGEALVDDPRSDPAFVIAVGESSLYSLVPDPPAPVLPVAVEHGIDSINPCDISEVIPALLDESQTLLQSQPASQSQSRSKSYSIVTHPILAIERDSMDDGESVYALMDVTLVTSEPARISEYTVASGNEHVTSVRSDGIVVATPAGSHGYAHDTGGPRIAPETDVGAVVPIAPFAISGDYWVLSLSDIRLTVERDNTPVDLFVDGCRVGTVSPEHTLTLYPVATLETIRVHERGLERL